MRAFIAIEIPAEVREALAACSTALAKLPAQASWTRPANIHLTLKFLGEIPETAGGAIHQAMLKAAQGIAPIALQLQSLGAFPNLRRPRVLWAGLGGQVEAAKELQARLENECEKPACHATKKPAKPHLTLARLRTVDNPRLFAAGVEGYRLPEPKFEAARIVLFRSELLPQGARYTQLAEAALGRIG